MPGAGIRQEQEVDDATLLVGFQEWKDSHGCDHPDHEEGDQVLGGQSTQPQQAEPQDDHHDGGGEVGLCCDPILR